jgi:tetratricopeptide (TPR) repeat protein
MYEPAKVNAAPPPLPHLLTNYLKRLQMVQVLEGCSCASGDSEVEPYHPGEVNLLEPRTALEDALASANWLLEEASERAQFQARQMRDLPNWSIIVRRVEPMPFVPMALGYFPQLVRELSDVSPETWQNWKPPVSNLSSTGLWDWGELMLMHRRPAEALFAAAVLRLLGQTSEARQLFRAIKSQAPPSWRSLLANEDAALAWQEGDFQTALDIFNRLEPLPPINFNRGLSLLLLGRLRSAREALAQAAAALPGVSAWHHLAQLYCLLAE